jgi:hypothetical protein
MYRVAPRRQDRQLSRKCGMATPTKSLSFTGGAFLFMAIVVYILFSERSGKFYTGHLKN